MNQRMTLKQILQRDYWGPLTAFLAVIVGCVGIGFVMGNAWLSVWVLLTVTGIGACVKYEIIGWIKQNLPQK